MAYTPPKYDPGRAEQVESELEGVRSELQGSQTAYSPNIDPTFNDLALDAKRKALESEKERLEGLRLSEQWYGKGREEQTFRGSGTQQSPLMRALNKLSNPLYGIVGAIESLTGTGSKRGLAENIKANIDEREGFGTVLGRAGAPRIISAPLGFGLDVMFDPVNWISAGTGALIPRIAMGAVKGASKAGAKGAVVGVTRGATSRLIPMGMKTANFLTAGGVRRAENTAAKLAASGMEPSRFQKLSAKIGETAKKLGQTGVKHAEEYDEALGRTMTAGKSGVTYGREILSKAGEPGWKLPFSEKTLTFGKKAENFIRDNIPGGDDLVRVMKYSPSDWARAKRVESEIINMAGKFEESTGIMFIPRGRDTAARIRAAGGEQWLEQKIMQMDREAKALPDKTTVEELDRMLGVSETRPGMSVDEMKFAEDVNDGIRFATGKHPAGAELVPEDADKMLALMGEARNDATRDDVIRAYNKLWNSTEETFGKIQEEMAKSRTGVGWYDRAHDNLSQFRIGNSKPLDAMLKAYSGFISFFKLMKVGASPVSHVNSVVGNLTVPALAGQNIADPRLLKLVKDITKTIYFGNSREATEQLLKKFFATPHWTEYAARDPLGFSGIYNFSLDLIRKKVEPIHELLRETIKKGKETGALSEKTLEKLIEDADISSVVMGKAVKATPNVPGKIERASWAMTEVADVDNFIMRFAKNLENAVMKENARLKRVENMRNLGQVPTAVDDIQIAGVGTKVANFLMNKPMEKFGDIDPIFRISNALHMTENGLTEREIIVMSRTFGIKPDDILDVTSDLVTGEKRFKMTPQKATEVVGEMYLNYAAMPAAVKMLRSLPIFGAPFASFTYGMSTRAGKAALYNPAVYNKTNLLLQEMSADKTPLEKEAMNSEYYSWFKDPGMIKFVEKYPVYANLINMIPYYSMNMFTPSERKYNETLPDSVLAFLDKVPLLQDPAGQVMFDYFIQPMMLSKGQVPQGAFGQALYPTDATGVQKLGYAGRTLLDSYTPGLTGVLGVPAGLALDTSTIGKIPGYNFRSVANAVQGKSTLGIPTKEDPVAKTARALSSMMGLKMYPMNTTFVESGVKKKLKGQ